MSHFAPLKNPTRTFDAALQWLTAHGFQVAQPAAGGSACTVSKNQCVAQIEAASNGSARIVAFPACLVAGEPAVLLDRGYQKFLKTGKVEVVATAADLENLHRFSEELKEATGYTSLYNEGLGSVSGSYQYDRVTNRDLPEDKRPPRPWQK
jgi:acylphosphatase